MNYSDSFYLQFRTALRFLSDKTHGAYRFAMADHQEIIPEIVRSLIQVAKENNLTLVELWLKKDNEQDFMTQIAQVMPCDALVIRNFSQYFYLPHSRSLLDYEAMETINYSREALLALEIPIIFWIEQESFAKIVHFATDFYSQRMGSSLHFTDKPQGRDEIIRIPESFSFPEDAALDIALYESQLADYPEALRVKDVVLPLANAYIRQAQPTKALELMARFIPDSAILKAEDQLAAADIYFRTGEKTKAQTLLQSLETRTDLSPLLYSRTCFLIAKVLDSDYNRFDEAFPYLQKALIHYESLSTTDGNTITELLVLYDDLINRLTEYGKLSEALTYATKMNALALQGYESYPNNVSFKNGLAISYSKLGETHSALGNLEKALTYYEDYNKLEKELYSAYPNNVEYHFNYAVSLRFMGQIILKQKGAKTAMPYLEQAYHLFNILFEKTKTPIYYQHLKECEQVMLFSKSGCVTLILKPLFWIIKIPFIKRKLETIAQQYRQDIKDEYKK